MKTAFGILACALLFYACNSADSNYAPEAYFDVPAFFKQEAARLHSKQTSLVKTIATGEAFDTLRVQNPDWNREFKLLQKANLNLPALAGKYRIERQTNDSLHTIRYSLPEGANGIVELKTVANSNGKVKKLHCHIFETSLLTTHSETWTFVADSGYAYAGFDRINGITTNRYEIAGLIAFPK